MNTEEKILSLLEFMAQDIGDLKQDVGHLKQDVGHLKQDVSHLKQDVGNLKQDVGHLKQGQERLENEMATIKENVTATRVVIENEVERNIRFLADGHMGVVQRLDRIEPVVENIEDDVSVIKAAVSSHSSDINKLKTVG